MDTYTLKGCAQIGDNLVCGAAAIAAAIAATLAAQRAAANAAHAKLCICRCGSGSNTKKLEKPMYDFECRASCTMDHGFPYDVYTCT